ncbi:MAG: patatin-like phospholipase family protein [Haliscomenobacter sp.]|nr:patatin-like phospholipase family protein [Haliscomenobacter sp.]
MVKFFTQVFYSFPARLLVIHLRSNLLLLGMWVGLVLLISGGIAKKLGFRFLFLEPEYLSSGNFWAFFLMGLALGCFYFTWNLTVYLLTAHHFPFLASLKNPFTKYCLNNFLLPLGFLLFYLISLIHFQAYFVGEAGWQLALDILGFLGGVFSILLIYILYFHFTNRDIRYYEQRREKMPHLFRDMLPGHHKMDVDSIRQERHRFRVDTYLNEALQPRLVRSVSHYDSRLLMRIFRQNHLNALIIQLATILVLMLLGWLIDHPFFRIPAGASFLFFLSIFVAIIGAINYWFNEWRITIMLLLLLLINTATRFEIAHHKSRAFGMDYHMTPAPYAYTLLDSLCSGPRVEQDVRQTEAILNRWKTRVSSAPGARPKLVLLSVSGGGLRSALWTMQVVQQVDSLLNGSLLNHTVLITGASGGMIGMAYLRELLLRQNQGEAVDLYGIQHQERITKDLLNPVAFTLVTNDLIMPWANFKTRGQTYRKDRGYAFERQLNENTDFLMDKTLSDYRIPEKEALVPMIYLTPSIVNDVRRLVISPQGVSFMMVAPIGVYQKGTVEVDAVDFGLVFQKQKADSLRFLSALRMNASYPYILPSVHLPSNPAIEVMDAGFRDNYGMLSATRFIQVFQNWIKANTSGVVLVQISSSEKIEKIPTSKNKGILSSLLNPFEIVGQILSLQEFEQDNSLGFVYDILGDESFDFVRFMYHPGRDNKVMASISFHITAKEKAVVREALDDPDNRESIRRLQDILGPSPNGAH